MTTLGASKVEMFMEVLPTATPSGVATKPTKGLSDVLVEREDVTVIRTEIGRTNM